MSPFSPSSIPEALSYELDASERAIWTGQPDANRVFTRALPHSFLSIFVLAFALFWVWMASTPLRAGLGTGTVQIDSVLFPLFGLILVVVGVLGVASPWTEQAKAPRTFYALTNRRALICVAGEKKTVKSILPGEFSLMRRDLPDGKGDVILKREVRGSGKTRRTIEIGFFGIADAREVERMARELATRPR